MLQLASVTFKVAQTNLRAATFRSPIRKTPPPEAVALWAPVESLRPRALFRVQLRVAKSALPQLFLRAPCTRTKLPALSSVGSLAID